jgi:hypothetical protein
VAITNTVVVLLLQNLFVRLFSFSVKYYLLDVQSCLLGFTAVLNFFGTQVGRFGGPPEGVNDF